MKRKKRRYIKRKRPHKEVARLARRAISMRFSTPRPTVRQIAAKLGVSYWAARHYIAGECKAMFKAGYFHY